MNSYRSILEVFKLLPPTSVLRGTSLTCKFWARISQEDELWTEFSELLSESEPLYFNPALSRKRSFQLQARSHHKLALFRGQELMIFNCSKETWRRIELKSFAPALHCLSSFLQSGELLCCGGLDMVSAGFRGQMMEMGAVASTYLFDLESEVARQVMDMLTPRHSHGMIAYGSAVYVFGGATDYSTLRESEQFLLSSRQWISLPNMKFPRRLFNPCASGNCIYLCGGIECQSLEVFDVTRQTYEVKDVTLPITRCWQCAAVTVNHDLVYLVGKSIVRMKLEPTTAVVARNTAYRCSWQDTNPQTHMLKMYYQQCRAIGRLDLVTYEVVLIELPPEKKIKLFIGTLKRRREDCGRPEGKKPKITPKSSFCA